MIKNFSVPNPCHERWDQMQPQGNGRHCESCQKIVIDFTKMTDQQIIDHISANAGKKMCGTFKNSQLPPPQQEIHHREKAVLFLAAVLLVFGMTLFSCQSVAFGDKGTSDPVKQEEGCTFITGAMIVSPPPLLHKDSSKANNGSLYNGDTGPAVIEKTPIKEFTTGEIEIPEPIIKDTVPDPDELIVGMIFTEQMPEFPGGTVKMQEYLSDNLHYPKEASDKDIFGTVYINFLVRKDGTLDNFKVLKGIGYGCDEEALRVIKNMPKWKPGINKGKPVDVQFNLPIKFKLK
jgi:TonB family protein